MKFNELEVLKEKLSEQDKFDYLYNSIPEELATKANLLTMKGDWETITTDLVEINQKLKRVTEKKQRVEEMETNYSKVTKNENLEEKRKYTKFKKGNFRNKNSDYKNYSKNFPRNKRNKNNIKCWKCGKLGHYAEDCHNKYVDNKNKFNKNNFKKYINKSSFKKFECHNNEINKSKNLKNSNDYKDNYEEIFFDDYNESYVESNNISILPFNKSDYFRTKDNDNLEEEDKDKNKNDKKEKLIAWTLDSGTSYHMTGDLNILDDIKEFKAKIKFADGNCVITNKIGTYNGYINDNKIKLTKVLYVPSFQKNLISIDGLSDQHFKTVFYRKDNKNYASIYKNHIKLCNTCANNTKTYVVWTSNNKINYEYICNSLSVKDDDSLHTWHRRLGHYNISTLRDKLSKINIKCKCKVCGRSIEELTIS